MRMNHTFSIGPYGAIAYRLDACAVTAHDLGEADLARTLWGIVDDLVALNLAGDEGKP